MAKQVFSHRNGETEPPTSVGGFWFRGEADKKKWSGIVIISFHNFRPAELWCDSETGAFHTQDYVGQWWGPFTPPWEDDAAESSSEIMTVKVNGVTRNWTIYK